MASAAVPGGRSLVGSLIASAPGFRRLAARVRPLIREHAGTVAAFTAVDYGAFGMSRYVGWIVTGVTILLLDFMVRGGE
jgi:hypothetical protein